MKFNKKSAMQITRYIYQQLLALPAVPPETGGLLGSHNHVIDRFYLDKVSGVMDRAMYIPDVKALNEQLARWAGDTDFAGIFHTHPPYSRGLSTDDKAYIQLIMMSMPQSVHKLYFPVVFPREEIRAFSAIREERGISIIPEKICLL